MYTSPMPQLIIALMLLLLSMVSVQAQEDRPQVHLFLDTCYGYDFNNPLSRNRDYTTQPARHNEFNLNLGLIESKYTTENMRAHLSLQTGTYVQSTYAAEPLLAQWIAEASVGMKFLERFWLDVGILPSHIGMESVVSKHNLNYTRSIMADNTPYYETGVRFSVDFSEPFSGQVLLLNGWQNIKENNSSKALGTQLQFKLWQGFIANWSTFLGNEQPDDQAVQMRFYNNFYGLWEVTPQLALALLFDIGWQQRQKNSDGWGTIFSTALQGRYKITPELAIGGRIEHYNDPEQIIVSTKTPQGYQVTSASLNVDVQLRENVLWRTEGRVFCSADPIYSTNTKDVFNQTSGLLVSSISCWF